MIQTDGRLKRSFMEGSGKGLSGFVWIMKILVPVSLFTALLAYSGLLNSLDVFLEPVMGMLGLPPMAILPLVVGLLTGLYGAIASMAVLPFTSDQMTLMAVFLLISHGLIIESAVQSRSGMPLVKAVLFRLTASVLAVVVVGWFLESETALAVSTSRTVLPETTLFLMLKGWALETLFLSGKIFAIVMVLMIIIEVMKNYDLVDRILRLMSPVLKILGLHKNAGILWLTAVMFGLAYGAAVIVEEAKEGNLSKEDLEQLHLSIGINHAVFEDPALFLSLGLGPFWLWIPRIVAAIVGVWFYKGIMVFRARFSKIKSRLVVKQGSAIR